MKTYNTNDIDLLSLRGFEAYQVYNGLDCCVTFEVSEALEPMLDRDNHAKEIFQRSMGYLAPALEMMLRGIRVDMETRHKVLARLDTQITQLRQDLNVLAHAVWDRPLNPNSPQQLKDFFYGALAIPKQYQNFKGERKLTANREALEKIRDQFPLAIIFVNFVLKTRDLGKLRSTLKSGVDPDNRIRCSYNVGGTDTGRWSSNENVFGTGTNLQNITGRLRDVFVADPGKKLAYIDLEQAESRVVGLLAGAVYGSFPYLDACLSGDLHTTVAKMVWPDRVRDRASADTLFYRDYTFRDMSKRGGHGTNYYGTPFTMARHLKVETRVMESFQLDYFAAFPDIPAWHKSVSQALTTRQTLVTPFNRKRYFFDRPWDDSTLRKAIAYVPQSTIADALNIGLMQVWQANIPGVEILAQIHDAILVQYPEQDEAWVLPEIRKHMEVPIAHGGKTIVIPTDCEVGWNWGKRDKEGISNPDGLAKWKGKDERQRTKTLTENILNWVR